MKRFNGFMSKQAQAVLANRQIAILYAVLLALLPLTAWISLALIALVTLKKGFQEGGYVLLPVLVAHIGFSLLSISLEAAILNTLIAFVPGYLAAYALRVGGNWQAVAAVFFLQVILVALVLQWMMPELITAQLVYVKAILYDAEPSHVVTDFLSNATDLKQIVLANYLFGVMAVSSVLGSLASLMSARSMQARLTYPGGFRQEVLMFRGNKISLAILLIISLAAVGGNFVAMDVLPILIFYFLLAGLSLCANIFKNQKSGIICLILLAPLVLLPFFMIPLYAVLGSLDSLFNLRVYLLRTE